MTGPKLDLGVWQMDGLAIAVCNIAWSKKMNFFLPVSRNTYRNTIISRFLAKKFENPRINSLVKKGQFPNRTFCSILKFSFKNDRVSIN